MLYLSLPKAKLVFYLIKAFYEVTYGYIKSFILDMIILIT